MTKTFASWLKKHREILCALGINLLFLLICLCFSHMQFGTNDDRDISNLLANVYGGEDGHYIAFVNVFLCKALAALYKATDNATNWYVIISVGISFISLTTASYILMHRAKRFPAGAALTIIFVGALCESHYIVFQFTQNAALYVAVGAVLLADMLQKTSRKGKLFRGIGGCVLMLMGSMLRYQSLYFTLPYLAMFAGYEVLFAHKDMPLLSWLKKNWKTLAVMCVSVLVAVGVRTANMAYYRSNPATLDYYEENAMRAELLDYGVPDYDENAEALMALGISREDLDMFANQSYLDKEVFNRDVVEALVGMKSEQSASYSAVNLKTEAIAAVFQVPDDVRQRQFWLLFFGVVLFLLLCMDWKRFLLLLGTLVVAFAMMWYFVSVGRMPYRVWYSITAPALLFCIYLGTLSWRKRSVVDQADKNIWTTLGGVGHDMGCTLLILTCAAVCVLTICHAAEDDTAEITDTYQKVIEYAESYPDDFFLLDRPTISRLTYTSTATPFTCFSRTSHQNVCIQGGWVCWTPANLSVLERWGMPNVYQAIGEGAVVYMICTVPPERELAFIQRHYNPNVTMAWVDSVNDLMVYGFYIATE